MHSQRSQGRLNIRDVRERFAEGSLVRIDLREWLVEMKSKVVQMICASGLQNIRKIVVQMICKVTVVCSPGRVVEVSCASDLQYVHVRYSCASNLGE